MKPEQNTTEPPAQYWPMSLAIVLVLAAALGSIGTIFTDASWWFLVVGVAAFVVVAMAFTRALSRFQWLVPVVGLALLIECLVFAFASDVALFGIIPTVEVIERFRDLVWLGFASIASQGIPARPDDGIIFLLTAGAGLLAIALDAIAITLRRPALVGIPVLALLALPTMFDPTLFDPFYFFLTAAAYLLVLYVGIGESRSVGAISVGAGAIAFALVFPVVLPPTVAGDVKPPANLGFSAGLDLFIDLGSDLRSPREVTVLTYTTDANHGQYLRISSVDSFSGPRWTASRPDVRSGTSIQQIGPPTGQATDVEVIVETTDVKLSNYTAKLLPAPYAPTKIAGLPGDWDWDQNNLTVSSPDTNERGERYEVTSAVANPTLQQLEAAGASVPEELDQYLRVPDTVDDSVGEIALAVTAGATSNFDKARKLEAYFKSGEFTYSEQAPVDLDYDSGGAEIIGPFLEQKSGYCVHFAAAMAIMARELGIPSRLSIGFTPGTFIQADENEDTDSYYSVTTKNLHAWPELYFDDIGWIRFEPTVSRGVQRTFDGEEPPPASAANPTSVPGEETAAPTSTPTATASPSPTPDLAAGVGGTNLIVPQITITALVLGMIAVLLLPLLPLGVRTIRRLARYSLVLRRGSAVAAWQELQDTAVDLGWEGASMTPKEFTAQRRQYLSERTREALARLQAAVEATAFSPATAQVTLRDLSTARAGLAQSAPRNDRWRAFITPRSVGSLRRQPKKQ